ncbi:IS630 family transposase, partial [Roseovarius sp. D22-M7]|uniref:IS630 family transposase n=1 Tax=Roseovarius sp. D22-M7 TaxID=3127116 RepID=UPI00300FD157
MAGGPSPCGARGSRDRRPAPPIRRPTRKRSAACDKRGLQTALESATQVHPGKRITLWFQDEMRVGQKGRLCHRWWTRGKRPPGVQDQRHEWAYLFGAARPGGGGAFALVLPTVDTDTMQIFLDRFDATLAEDEHAVMVVDGAGWHTTRALVVPPNVTLVPLPPYSPQLNPMERVWLYLRDRFLSL